MILMRGSASGTRAMLTDFPVVRCDGACPYAIRGISRSVLCPACGFGMLIPPDRVGPNPVPEKV